MATKANVLAEGGRDVDALEDVDEFFDKSIVKDQFELTIYAYGRSHKIHIRMASNNDVRKP
jgi:hypothetical protein